MGNKMRSSGERRPERFIEPPQIKRDLIACKMMRSAGFPEAVQLNVLRRIVERNDDKLLRRVPAKVSEGIEQLRQLSEEFEFRDDYLRRIQVADEDPRLAPAMSVAACRYALAQDAPNEKRLPLICLRAYARACEYAEALERQALVREREARYANILATALGPLGDDARWGQFLTRGGAWKGTAFSEIAEYVLSTSGTISPIHTDAYERIAEVDRALEFMQNLTKILTRRANAGSGRPAQVVKHHLIRRLVEIYSILCREVPPIYADLEKNYTWPLFIRNCVYMCGAVGKANSIIKNDLDLLDKYEIANIVEQANSLEWQRGEDASALRRFCELPSALDLIDAGLGAEPFSAQQRVRNR